MPRIQLKPNSAEYADGTEKPETRCCDMPGCPVDGHYKAPRSRHGGQNDYFWFCLEHVQEYNSAWDYFSGMSQREIEEQLMRSALWDRPTRRYDGLAALEEQLYRTAWKTYHYTDKEPEKPKENGYRPKIDTSTPEFQAMAIMGLEPPLSLKSIKARYKELVKKHHPDVNGGDAESGELLKKINMAYTILKLSFEKYEKLGGTADHS